MRTKTVLSADDTANIITAAKAEALAKGWNVSIAVVDEGGYLMHLERMDSAPLPSAEIAFLKAKTAAIAKASTKTLEDIVKDRPAVALMPGRLPVQGGVPILHHGECIGGIGVSGVKSHEDEVVAMAGLAALLGNVA